MIDEKKIEAYLGLYRLIDTSLKKPTNHINWDILKTQEAFIESLSTKNVYDHQVEQVKKEFNDFIKTWTSVSANWLTFMYLKQFNPKIDLATEKAPDENQLYQPHKNNLLLEIAYSIAVGSAQSAREAKEAKRQLKNTYQALLTIKQCLTDCGLLMSEINKRPEYARYNFILSVQTGARKKTIPHYGITKTQMEAYAASFNLGEDMHINGLSAEFSSKNDVLITATKLKSPDEIDAYKKRERIYGDLSFAKNRDICMVITSDYIKIKVVTKAPKPDKSTHDLIEDGKIKEALKLALTAAKTLKQNVNNLTLLSSRFNKLETDNKKGLVTNADYNVNYTQITAALLHEIEEKEAGSSQ